MCCSRLAANTGCKKVAKNRHLGTIAQLRQAISLDYSFAESFAECKLQTKTELNPKSEVTFFFRTQPLSERKFSLGVSLSSNFGLSDLLSKN